MELEAARDVEHGEQVGILGHGFEGPDGTRHNDAFRNLLYQ
jgi:hypothetical protein